MATQRTYKKKMEFLKHFNDSACNISVSCEKVGIERGTFYNWREKDLEFRKKVSEAEEKIKDYVESKIMKSIQEGNERLITLFAKCKLKDRGWTEKTEIEHTGNVPLAVNINIEAPKEGKKNPEEPPKEAETDSK